MSRQYRWSALDMALILELAVQKEGNVQENVSFSLNSLAKKDFRREDSEMPGYLRAMAEAADPVGITRNVVDNFYGALLHQEDQFQAEPTLEEMADEFGNRVAADMVQRLQDIGTGKIPLDEVNVSDSPLIVDYRDGKVLYGGVVHHDIEPKGKIYAQGSMDRLRHNS